MSRFRGTVNEVESMLGRMGCFARGATVSDDELRRAALQRIADNAKIVIGPPYIHSDGAKSG